MIMLFFLFYSQKKDCFNALLVSNSLSERWSSGGEFVWLIFDPKITLFSFQQRVCPFPFLVHLNVIWIFRIFYSYNFAW